jgi:hypothetical protein
MGLAPIRLSKRDHAFGEAIRPLTNTLRRGFLGGRDQLQRVRIYHILPVKHVFLVISEEENDTSGRARSWPYPDHRTDQKMYRREKGRMGPAPFLRLQFFKCTGKLTELQSIAIVDRSRLIRFQAFVVNACCIRTIQIGQSISSADMLKRGVDA